MRRRFLMGCPEPVEDGYEYIAKDCPINDVYGVRSDINFHTGDILEFDIEIDETVTDNDIFRVSDNGQSWPAFSFFVSGAPNNVVAVQIFYPSITVSSMFVSSGRRIKCRVDKSGITGDVTERNNMVGLIAQYPILKLVIEPHAMNKDHVYIHYIRIKRGV